MQGVVIHGRHDLRVEELSTHEPGPGEVAVRVEAAGICGSDLHYYHDGRIGSIVLKEPLVLGHELSGTVAALGPGVDGPEVGTRVAVDPSRPCWQCTYCLSGQARHCLDMRFLGSAIRFPHVQGGFREMLVVEWRQAVPVTDNVSFAEAAMAEPLAVCLHAAAQAGSLLGKKVLVTGCGPIGALCVAVARLGGAAEIVVTDIVASTLGLARQLGATAALDLSTNSDGLALYSKNGGHFDVLLEASGAEAALRGGLEVLRPSGYLIQVGMAGDLSVPINILVSKEIQLRGTFRFDSEFRLAVDLINQSAINVGALLTETVPISRAVEGFDLASDRQAAMKVQIHFNPQ